MTHTSYPVALNLFEKGCLVVGGGQLATEKVEGLLHARAIVRVVSRTVSPRIEELAGAGAIDLRRRPYRPRDLADIYLAFGASEDRDLNATVAADAREAGIIVNAVDDIPNCDFFAMAITHRKDLQVAVTTNGDSPALARWTREHLDATLPEGLGDLLEILGQIRREIKAQGPVPEYAHWKRAIDAVLPEVEAGNRHAAERTIRELLTHVHPAPNRQEAA